VVATAAASGKAPGEGRAATAATAGASRDRRPSVGAGGRANAVRTSLMEAAVASAPAHFTATASADDRVASLFDATADVGGEGNEEDEDAGTQVVVAVAPAPGRV